MAAEHLPSDLHEEVTPVRRQTLIPLSVISKVSFGLLSATLFALVFTQTIRRIPKRETTLHSPVRGIEYEIASNTAESTDRTGRFSIATARNRLSGETKTALWIEHKSLIQPMVLDDVYSLPCWNGNSIVASTQQGIVILSFVNGKCKLTKTGYHGLTPVMTSNGALAYIDKGNLMVATNEKLTNVSQLLGIEGESPEQLAWKNDTLHFVSRLPVTSRPKTRVYRPN